MGDAAAKLAACLTLAAALAACPPTRTFVSAACLPGEPPAARATVPDAGRLEVYLDVSQSVTNFGRHEGESPYTDFLAWLLGLGSEFAEASTYGFADRIAEIEEDVVVSAARGAAGPCSACGFQESRLDDVLSRIAAVEARGSLSVVVTDLWIDNSDLIGSGRAALQRSVRGILTEGRAIAVIGVVAPYTSPVYDIPGPGGPATIPAGRVSERPLFIVLTGPPKQVAGLVERVADEVFTSLGREQLHYSVFSPTLVLDGPVEHRLAARDRVVRPAIVLSMEGADVPSFVIDQQTAASRGLPGADSESEGEPAPALASPVAVDYGSGPAPGAYELEARAWALGAGGPAGACEDGAWISVEVGQALQLAEDPNAREVHFDVSHPTLFAIRPGEAVFVRYTLSVGSLDRDGPSTAWLDDWSFDAAGGGVLRADPPPFFPALNLDQFGQTLTSTVGALVAGETVVQGSLLLSVE